MNDAPDQDVQEAAGTLLAMQAGGYRKSIFTYSLICQGTSQPIAAEAPPRVSDNSPPVRRSPRLATRAAADGRVPDKLPPVRRSPRLAAKAVNEKRLKKQSPESSKRCRSTKNLSQDRKLAFGKWGVRKVRSSIARALLQIRWAATRARSARRAYVHIHRVTSSVAENSIG
ncbi:hypothetical protein SLE2022_396690 [Rubroshorea leprosula]